MGKMEKKMETLVILGLYRDNGKENRNCYSILGLYWDKEHGNYRA